MIDGPRLAPFSGRPPEHLVIMLHGYGSDGDDMMELAKQWQRALPEAAFACPNAPEPCDQSPFGYQWFPLTHPKSAQYWPGVQRTGPLLDQFISAELGRYGLVDSRLALVGFSQGTMMALHVGLRRNPPQGGPLAAILGYSGTMAGPEFLLNQIKSRPPVMLIHGELDDVITLEAHDRAVAALVQAGVPVESHISHGIGHAMGIDGLELGLRFVQEQIEAVL